MVGLPDGKQIKDMFGGVDRIPACDRRTDILRRHSPRYAYASRGKNEYQLLLLLLGIISV